MAEVILQESSKFNKKKGKTDEEVGRQHKGLDWVRDSVRALVSREGEGVLLKCGLWCSD